MTGFKTAAPSVGAEGEQAALRVTTSIVVPEHRRADDGRTRRSAGAAASRRLRCEEVHHALEVAEHHRRADRQRAERPVDQELSLSQSTSPLSAFQAVMRSLASAANRRSVVATDAFTPPALRVQRSAACGVDAAHRRLEGARAEALAVAHRRAQQVGQAFDFAGPWRGEGSGDVPAACRSARVQPTPPTSSVLRKGSHATPALRQRQRVARPA